MVSRRGHASAIRRSGAERIRDGHLIAREETDTHGRGLVIGLHTRRRLARTGVEGIAIRVGGACVHPERAANAHSGDDRVITDSDAHICRLRIAEEVIDSGAQGDDLRAAGAIRIGHRAGHVRKEIQIGHLTRDARTALADTVARHVASAAMGCAGHCIDTRSVTSGLSTRTDARTVLTGCSRRTNDIASAAMARVGHGIDTLPVAYGLSYRART